MSPDRSEGIVALIPALDEEEALPGVLQSLREAGVRRVVVIDNGSTDGTARVARQGGAEVVLEPERGYGAACLAGIRHVAAAPPEVVVFLDADQSDDPEDLDRLLAPLEAGQADFVVGVRCGPASTQSGNAVPAHARLGNAVVLWGARCLHGAEFRDLGPFRAIRYTALQELRMDDRNWGWTLQMQLRASRLGLRTREVEVQHRPRAAGRSKVSGSVIGTVRAGTKMLYTLVRELRSHSTPSPQIRS